MIGTIKNSLSEQAERKENCLHDIIAMLRRFWLAFFVAFLFMKSTAGIFWSEENRFFFHWSRSDAFAVFLAIGLVAGAFFAAYLILRRFGRWGRFVLEFSFVCVALFYLKVNLGEMLEQTGESGARISLLLKGLVVGAALLFFFKRRVVVRAVVILCLMLSPIMLMYALTLVRARPFCSTRLAVEAGLVRTDRVLRVDKVLFFLFDEWSYQRTFDGHDISQDFPNIARMAEQSLVFHQAFSVSHQTFDVVPTILCGFAGRSVLRNGVVCIEQRETTIPCDESEHLFKEMKKRGYRTAMYGSYIPYPEVFQTGLDHCDTRDIYKVLGTGSLQVCASMILENVAIRFGRIHCVLSRPFYWAKHRYFVRLAEWTQRQSLKEIASDRKSFVFVHYEVPHMPFIFTGNGPRENLSDPATLSIKDYMGNLRFMDRLVGELLDAVKSSSLADRTLVVMTSDHSFRFDPELTRENVSPEELCRIPLFIHLPGQSSAIDINGSFSSVFLKDVLTQYIDEDMTVEDFAAVCNSFKRSDIQILQGNSLVKLSAK